MSTDDHFQLVTWSKDQTLHLWPVSKELACGHRVEPESVVGVFDEDDVSMPASLESTPFASQSSATQTTPQALGLGVTGVSLMPISERGRNIDLMPFTDDEDDDQAGAGSIAGGMALGRTQTRADNCLELAIDSPLADAIARKYYLQNTSDERSYSMSLQCTSDVFRTSPGPASVFLRIDVHFPPGYPGQGAVPNFEIQKSGMVSMSNRAHLSQRLSQISMVHVSRKLPCLEDCVRYLLGESSLAAPHFGAHIPIDTPPPASLSGGSTGVSAESYQGREALAGLDIGGLAHPGEELSLSETSSSDAEGPFALGRFKPLTDRRFMQDGPGSKDSSNVPYPRLCGASFSMSGHLVFFRSSLPHPSTTKFKAQIFSMRSQYPVRQLQAFTSQPKTLAQYFQYRNFLHAASFGNIGDPFGSVRPDGPGGFGQHASSYGGTLIGRPIDIAKPLASSQHAGSLESGTSMDGSPDLIGHVLPLTGDDPAHICRTNRKHAKAARRMDLVRIWRLAELILSRETSTHDGANKSARDADESGGPFSKMHWLHHPMGQSMVQSMWVFSRKPNALRADCD
nr:hypothetical protein HK105_007445 [Polyrhizophydium stewartii]